MLNTDSPHQALDRIFDAHRKGLCDKVKTLNLVGQLHRKLPAPEAAGLCKILTDLFRVSEMTSYNVGGYVVNMAALVLSCLADVGSTQQLPGLIFSRLPIGDSAKTVIWAQELLSELQWSLMRCPQRFDAGALNRIKDFAANVRGRIYFDSAPVVSALDNLEKAVEWVEFQRFAESISGGEGIPQTLHFSLENPSPISGLNSTVTNALEEARKRLTTQGEFDPKMAADLIRTAVDEAHREIVEALAELDGKPFPGPDKDGARRAYMRSLGFITQPEEEFFSAIYSFISRETSHKLITPRETALLLHQIVSSYLLLLMERLNKRGTDSNLPLG